MSLCILRTREGRKKGHGSCCRKGCGKMIEVMVQTSTVVVGGEVEDSALFIGEYTALLFNLI